MGSKLKNLKKNQQPLKSKIDEAFARGFKAGKEHGVKRGVAQALNYFDEKLREIESVHGVGNTMARRILEHMGYERIEEMNKE